MSSHFEIFPGKKYLSIIFPKKVSLFMLFGYFFFFFLGGGGGGGGDGGGGGVVNETYDFRSLLCEPF